MCASDALERRGNNEQGATDMRLKNGSSQNQNLASTVLCVPNSLDSGRGAFTGSLHTFASSLANRIILTIGAHNL